MAPWLVAALRLIAGGFGAGAAFQGGQALVSTGGAAGPVPGLSDLFLNIPGIGEERKPRRRRRRALTHSDKDDIAFIAATVGEPTARKFALLLAAHHS